MQGTQNRYFIELQPDNGVPIPRYRETETRRELAAKFIIMINDWLREEEINDRVSALAITALGQVQITCEADVIDHIRNQEVMDIAAIRQPPLLTENVSRWIEMRQQG